ncbi:MULTISPECIES: hypothetical protein [Achromobacter]|uniref:Lipoprotein n=1 Tax=Achromobacter mucicolens TaxID=1389922 RepID=A0ABM8LK77_9BURK|nr:MULTISPECIES: hypothetical protein [Achromobacter]AVG43918.1 hypothetical protein MC81_30905 [Achromobacter insolitus]CAB3845585.1 hypothetical protein LMG3410_01497 [Achromobacter aegrifaciens]CAB3914423.1 hypothetical protein LMG3415_05152 [Achromobacter mucicolens]
MNQIKVIFALSMLVAGVGTGCIFGWALEAEGINFAALVVGFTVFSWIGGAFLFEASSSAARWFKR